MPDIRPLPVALSALRYSLKDANITNETKKIGGTVGIVLKNDDTKDPISLITYYNDKYHIQDLNVKSVTSMDNLKDVMISLNADQNVINKIEDHLNDCQERYDAHVNSVETFKMR